MSRGHYDYRRLDSEEHAAEPEHEAVEMGNLYAPMAENELQELDHESPHTHDRWRHQKNLDRFFRRCYRYYRGKGLGCMVSASVFDFIIVLFVAFIITFLLYCVDYNALVSRIGNNNTPCPGSGSEAIPLFATDLFSADCHGPAPMSLQRLSTLPPFSIAMLSLSGLGWIFCFLTFVLGIPELVEMKIFYRDVLKISSDELQTVPWSVVLKRLIEAQRVHQLCITVRELDQLDITNLITRRTNYMIALYAKNTLPTEISVPLLGEWQFMPLLLQWNIDYVLSRCIFDGYSNVRPRVMSDDPRDHQIVASALRFHFKLLGVCCFLLAPFIFVYRVALFIFQHSDEIRNFSGRVSSRHFSPYAQWKLRDFCEVDHYFQKRLARCYTPSKEYVAMFSSEWLTIIARFLSVLLGGFFFTLIALGFVLDEGFFLAHLTPERSVTWWIGVSGVLLAVCRSLIPDENLVFDPATKMHVIALHSHYLPDGWRGREGSPAVLAEFGRLFQFRIVTFLEEVMGSLVVPYLLIFRFPRHTDNLVRFFRTHTSSQKGIGDVCTYALFGSRQTATARIAETSLDDVPDTVVDIPFQPSDSKMEHSLINFKMHNEDWKPDDASSVFLASASAAAAVASNMPLTDSVPVNEQSGLNLHNSLLQPSKPRLGTLDFSQL
eukprot:m.231457 g.231457  ORF g.231457 m.231457 type:complete len:662 (+) comp12220_c0_seq1:47-2032(+)